MSNLDYHLKNLREQLDRYDSIPQSPIAPGHALASAVEDLLADLNY